MTKGKHELLDELARTERMLADVIAGKEVRCSTCDLPLQYYGPGSGRHPGVYYEMGCTVVLMELKRT